MNSAERLLHPYAQVAEVLILRLALISGDLHSILQKPCSKALVSLKASINAKLFDLFSVPRIEGDLDAGLVFGSR